ncbi:MAG: hypothetical protein ABL998_19300 [Planctomycetota bacterium]
MNALLLSLPLLFASGSIGDQLRKDRLPADVDFVMHLDLEGFKATELWKLAQKDGDFHAEFDELKEVEERFGLNPLTDVRAITLYKVEKEEDPTVVLLSTSAKVDAALEKLRGEAGYRRLSEGKIELHTWKERNQDDENVFAYLHGSGDERVVVLASKRESALHAARVLRGEDVSLARSGTGLTVAPASGSFLYMSAASLSALDEFAPASQVLGLAQGLQFDVGEAGGLLQAHMGLAAADADKAFHLSNTVNGFISLAYLAGQELGDVLELLSGLKVRAQGANVTMDFEFELDRLVEILRSLDDDGGDEEELEPVEPVDRSEKEKVRRR